MVTPEGMQAWRNDICLWCEECVHLFHPEHNEVRPLKLEEHQRRWLTEMTRRRPDGRFVYRVGVISLPKRSAKTTTAVLLAGWRMATMTSQRVLVLSVSETQARSVGMDMLLSIFRDSPVLRECVPDTCFQALRLEVPALDNVAEAVSASWRSIQGRRCDLLLSDELHAADGGAVKAFEMAGSQCEGRDAQVAVASQCGLPVMFNPVWRFHEIRDREDVHFMLEHEPLTPWAREMADRAKASLLPSQFDYLHRNQWGSSSSALFDVESIEAAAMDYTQPETREEWLALGRRWGIRDRLSVGAGLDRSGFGADRTAYAVVARFPHEGKDHFRVVRLTVWPVGSEQEILTEHAKAQRIFGTFGKVYAEQYQSQDLSAKLDNAELVPASSPRQMSLFTRLYRCLSERRLGFPKDAGIDPKTGAPGLLKSELLTFASETTVGGMSRFGAKGGVHDDTTFAVGWACQAADEPEPETVRVDLDTLMHMKHGWRYDALRLAEYGAARML